MKSLISAAALILMTSTAALAQDVDPLFGWGGFYGGITIGYGSGDALQTSTFSGLRNTEDFDGFLGGAVVGYNFQNENLVFGVEVDGSLSGMEGSSASASGKTCSFGIDCNQQIDSLFTARARLGYAFDNILPFVTAGIALADVVEDTNTPTADIQDWETGLVFGGGVEVAGTNSWRYRAEYLTTNFTASSRVTINPFVNTNDVGQVHIFRIGITKGF